jgi:hypothetical protein
VWSDRLWVTTLLLNGMMYLIDLGPGKSPE